MATMERRTCELCGREILMVEVDGLPQALDVTTPAYELVVSLTTGRLHPVRQWNTHVPHVLVCTPPREDASW